MTVAVVDPAGRLLCLKRMDGCANGPAAFAEVKATTAASVHGNTRDLKDRYADRVGQVVNMVAANQPNGGFWVGAGGVLITLEDGTVVGAVGVSGGSADEDEHCGVIAAHSAGFSTSPLQGKL